jgi:tRNA (mo5U34)-methyltransferase
MIDYSRLSTTNETGALGQWLKTLPLLAEQALLPEQHGSLSGWQQTLAQLPALTPQPFDVHSGAIRVGNPASAPTQEQLTNTLMQLHPWRKGPYSIHGVHIDTEWRSDLKWERLRGKITPLEGRAVLDIGCGSGYHCWRMCDEGARLTIGIEPYLLSVMQFCAISHFITPQPIFVLPLGIEQLPLDLGAFDTVFSMGLLYHRRDALDHLRHLFSLLRPGGELVLETLVLNGSQPEVLRPAERYAQMRNVWAIPSVPTLLEWVSQSGFSNVRLIDVTPTSPQEQRPTPWMRVHSLQDFLDPSDISRTIEGHPAPVRAMLTAHRP